MADLTLAASLPLPKGSVAWRAMQHEILAPIRVVFVSPVRLLGEGLVRALRDESAISVVGMVQQFGKMRELLRDSVAAIGVVDVSGEINLDEVRLFAAERPEVKLLALGLAERQADVIRCARAGFRGYIARDTPFDDFVPLLSEAARGGARCTAEIATALMQALFRADPAIVPPGLAGPQITSREGEVLRLLGRGFSNKEIARELTLSGATVKNHVHNILAKFGASRRGDLARRVREQPWIAGPSFL
jgi:DNA-binding NarL/FixJ family response regulator